MSPKITRYGIQDIDIEVFNENSTGLFITSLGELIERHNNMISQPHRICFNQILLITEGDGILNIDSNQIELSPRKLVAMVKGQVESLFINRNTKGYVVQYTEEFIHRYPGDLDWINNLKLFNPYVKPYCITLSSIEHLNFLNIIDSILSELNNGNDDMKNDILANLLKTFLLLAERIKRSKAGGTVTSINDWSYVIEFKKKLENNFHISRSVNFYAGELNITQKKLNNITTGFWGKNAKQVIEERVLLEIKRMLVYTNKTIKEIGLSLGFNDPTNFNKFFKKYEHYTPANFRSLNKKSSHYHTSAVINHL
jgi:AraC-like DNA-binding protein